jgi:hypothetical protein
MTAALASFYKLSAYVDNFSLAANTPETITKPSGYNSCILCFNADVWLRRGGDGAVPAADVTDGTGSVLIPAGQPRLLDFRDPLPSGDTLAAVSVESAGAALGSAEWFR